MVDIDLGLVKGPKGDSGEFLIDSEITDESTNDKAAGAKAVYDLVIGAIEGEY